jgi:hypothetical protein
MLATSQGYVPEKGYLTVGLAVQGLPSQLRPKTDSVRPSQQYLRSQARFHDPLGDSVCPQGLDTRTCETC